MKTNAMYIFSRVNIYSRNIFQSLRSELFYIYIMDMNICRNAMRIMGKYYVIDNDSSKDRNYEHVLRNSFHNLRDFLTS